MFTDLEFIKTCLNGLRNRIEKVENWVVSFMRTNRPDWAQNDSNALDYVKNRPFYTEDPVETVLVEENTVTFTNYSGNRYEAEFSSPFEATVGDTYKVSWDGTAYECTCILINDTLAIGNPSIVGAGSDTGEPFVIGIMNEEKRIQIFTTNTSTSHTFSISRIVVPVVIDKKYLIQPDWNQSDETAADYVKNRPFYSETGNVTIKNATGGVLLKRFPVFAIGDTVTVNVDSVEHSLVAYNDEGLPTIGDTFSNIKNGEGQLGWQIYVDDSKTVSFFATEVHTVSYRGIDYYHKIDPKYLPESFKPESKSYLTFSSLNSFTLAIGDATKHWDGTIEYFASDRTWTIWDGTTTLSSVDNDGQYVLYLRGTGNTVITGNSSDYRWILTGSNIACIGNIENLLNYVTVKSGAHPTMAPSCYAYMFYNCTSLIQAPVLPATELKNNCYNNMFYNCTSLIQAPALPATTLANSCYNSMFRGCTGLTQAPALPATMLSGSCYSYMFQGCTSLTQTPALPATTLGQGCYAYMFQGCTSLTQAPALPATTLEGNCYNSMFKNCTSLTQAPALPATTLAGICYNSMFYNCTSLTQAPALPATTLTGNCYSQMFRGCTGLTQAPALPATTLAEGCYSRMFYGCTSLKLSTIQTGEYTQKYRIPSSGTGTIADYALEYMFTSTGGTFTGTPEINTTYYLSTDNVIVRETEIATLNGHVISIAAPASHVSDSTVHITADERTAWNAKQDSITGTQGQIVGFDASGAAVAQDKPTYTAAEVGALPANTVIPSIDGLATETYVNNAVAEVNAVPSATTDDNDKILMVVNGVPAWAAVPSAEEASF